MDRTAEKSRRGYGEGAISERNGQWRARARVQGRRVSATFETEAAAKKWLRQTLADADRGMLPADSGRVTVGAFLDRWLAAIIPSVKPKTIEQYRSLVRFHLVPALGLLKLCALRPDHLQGLYAQKLTGGLAGRTVLHLHRLMHNALGDAVEWGLVYRNAADAARPPRPPRAELNVWTPEQARAFLAGVAGQRLEAAYRIALACGLRVGELLGLTWADVDLDAHRLHVRRTLTRLAGGKGLHVGEPKSATGRRQIRLSPSVVDALRRWKVRQLEERLIAGERWRDTGNLFTSTIGTPIEPRNFTRAFERDAGRLGLPRIRVHDLRHTCATLLLSENVPAKVVQELLGHSQIALTLDTYSHVLPDMHATATAAMERVLAGG